MSKMPATAPRTDCPCCLAPVDPVPQTITDRYGWTWPLGTCRACGVRYQTAPMTHAARVAFYASGQYRDLVEILAPGSRARLPVTQRAYARRWLPHIGSLGDKPLLDYGGSAGHVSAVLVGRWAGKYVAPDSVVVADYGDGAPVTPEQALDVPDGHYGAVLCAQTLDHLRDPLVTLQQFRRVTKPTGRLFVDVVKGARVSLKIDHETYYPTITPFLRMVERAGWRVLWLRAEVDPRHYAILAEVPA